ncbi:hypothetical protein [Paenibacillus sp. 32352]|uniref:hypothetical protein n=1 Tax=Paenibacillus sp. 32352 TaxID=1969111 RepID=UPI0009ABE1C6|nr:hypothetical protein [Paenibacillus sp. 32352]
MPEDEILNETTPEGEGVEQEPSPVEVMRHYAYLDDNGVCYAISSITAELPETDRLIHLDAGHEVNMGDRYEDGVWISAPPREPLPEPIPFELIGQQLVERELENLELKADNELLGRQLVDLEIRLMEGGL